MQSRVILLIVSAGLFALAGAPASAGTIALAWNPVSDADLAGYRIYYSSGGAPQYRDVGRVTSATLVGLTDCSVYNVRVRARDAAGNLSAHDSNPVIGYPRPAILRVTPAAAERGRRLDVVIGGANFASEATVRFGSSGITVHSITARSCTEMTVNITVASGAPMGSTNVEVTNPDGVFGVALMFTVLNPSPPTVTATVPANQAGDVAVTTLPRVLFSEPMDPASLTPATIRLLDPQGNAVAQVLGSPVLSADGRTATITPVGGLDYAQTYRIEVIGGASGVKDLAGTAMSSTYRQAPGFTTVRDSSAPYITEVAVSADATTADVSWSTSEAAIGRVFYRRRIGEVNYQSSALVTALGTEHSIRLAGLAPATEYTFYLQSVDEAGNRAEYWPAATFTTLSSQYSYIVLEAESGALSSPIETAAGEAFGGAWIETPAGTIGGTPAIPAGTARLSFYAPSQGTWYAWARLQAPVAGARVWYESVDGALRRPISASASGAWEWVAGGSHILVAGLHDYELGGGDAQARADRVVITNDPAFVPTEQPADDVTRPEPPAGLAQSVTDDSVTLTWSNPESDVATNVVRYRTDGRYPMSPADGLPAEWREATESSFESFTHQGVLENVTYWYSVFVVDQAGNASDPAQIQAVPGSGTGQLVTLFSTDQDQYLANIGTLRNQNVYVFFGSHVERLGRTFLYTSLGLDAVHLKDASHLLFSTKTSGGVTHDGGFITLGHANVYSYDVNTHVISPFYDLDLLGVSSLDAIAMLGDQVLVFSTSTVSTVWIAQGGRAVTLLPQNAYRLDMTTGRITLFFDGAALGLSSLDALDVDTSGEIVFSTATDQSTHTGFELHQQDGYAWDPTSGQLRIAFDGRDLGLYNLDALDLSAILPPIPAEDRGPEPEP